MTRKRGFHMVSPRSQKASSKVTEARAVAQRDKLDAQAEARRQQAVAKKPIPKPSRSRKGQEDLLSKRRSATTVERAIANFLDDQEGGNHSAKTLEWHRTALRFFHLFLKEERSITLVAEIDAPDISAWFASMRKTPTGRGRIRTISLWELRPGRPRHGWRRRWPGMSSRRCGAIPSSAPSCPRSRPLLLLSHTVLEQYRPST